MATRAERFRAEQERARPDRPARAVKASPGQKIARLRAEASGTVDGVAAGSGLRNLIGEKKAKKATYALEDSTNGSGPSRKSTRRSSREHIKAATSLTSRQKLRADAPAARHGRRS